MFISQQPAKNEILDNPIYQQKAAQLSLFRKNQLTDTGKSSQELETAEPLWDSNEITEVPKEQDKFYIGDFTLVILWESLKKRLLGKVTNSLSLMKSSK